MPTPLSLIGGHILWSDGAVEMGDLHIADGIIVDDPASDALKIDCTGLHVLPGIIDVHGDAFERELHPRPGVDIAFPIAMTSVDQQLLGNGITTAYHGLTLSWEPGARSLDAGRAFMDGLRAFRPALIADHRVQLRWETFAHDAVQDIGGWVSETPTPVIAFNDHTTSTIEKVAAGEHKKLDQWAQRAQLSTADYLKLAEKVWGRAEDVPGQIEKVAKLARRNDAIMLSHDDRTLEDRQTYRALGSTVCEFPLAKEVAIDSIDHKEHVVLGGPNVIRGGSHTGAMGAEDAINEKLCTVLASDYYYPSLLHAAAQLVERKVKPLPQAWNLISKNPAQAMGLSDRGAIDVGLRADIVVVDTDPAWRVVRVVSAGTVIGLQ